MEAGWPQHQEATGDLDSSVSKPLRFDSECPRFRVAISQWEGF